MLVPTLVAAASVFSVVVEHLPGASDGQPHRLAVTTTDGDVLISPDRGVSWHLAAHCSLARTAPGGELDLPRRGTQAEPEPELPPGAEVELDPEPDQDEPPRDHGGMHSWSREWVAPSTCEPSRPAVAIAWLEGALYVACPGEPLLRWHEETGVRPVMPASIVDPRAASGTDASTASAQISLLRDVAAMTGDHVLWLASARGELWTLDAGMRLTWIATLPEPVLALARWQRALMAAGATALWQGSASWQAIAPLRACALSASGQGLWIAGPEGLAELAADELRVHAVAPLSGVAVHGQHIWLASGRGPLVHATTSLAHLVMSDPPALPGETLERAPLGDRESRDAPRRARWSRWLPRLVTQIRWTRARERAATNADAPWLEPHAARYTDGLTVLVLLSWSLDPNDTTITALEEGIP